MHSPDPVLKTSVGERESPGEPVARITVALARGFGEPPTTDIRLLLHRRLRFLAVVMFGGMAVLVAFSLAMVLNGSSGELHVWQQFAVYSVMVVVAAALTST